MAQFDHVPFDRLPNIPNAENLDRWAKTADVAGEFIKPNDRLTSLERLEIYNQPVSVPPDRLLL